MSLFLIISSHDLLLSKPEGFTSSWIQKPGNEGEDEISDVKLKKTDQKARAGQEETLWKLQPGYGCVICKVRNGK